jgi:hypothetical protein
LTGKHCDFVAMAGGWFPFTTDHAHILHPFHCLLFTVHSPPTPKPQPPPPPAPPRRCRAHRSSGCRRANCHLPCGPTARPRPPRACPWGPPRAARSSKRWPPSGWWCGGRGGASTGPRGPTWRRLRSRVPRGAAARQTVPCPGRPPAGQARPQGQQGHRGLPHMQGVDRGQGEVGEPRVVGGGELGNHTTHAPRCLPCGSPSRGAGAVACAVPLAPTTAASTARGAWRAGVLGCHAPWTPPTP